MMTPEAAEAEVEAILVLSGRGPVLVLKPEFKGTFRAGEMLYHKQKESIIAAVEFIDRATVGQSRVGLIVEDDAVASAVKPGETVRSR